MKKCEECMLHHPERPPERACSAFGLCENREGNCSMHMKRPENAMTVEEFCRRRLEGAKCT